MSVFTNTYQFVLDYDGLHYDEFVPASENIDKNEVIEEFLGVDIDIDGESLDEYLLELVSIHINLKLIKL